MQKVIDGAKLQITFKYDTLCQAHIRINMCVTEKRNPNNAPEMFYTPNRENYIQNLTVGEGLGQEVEEGAVEFDLNYMVAFELQKSIKDYHPMIISANYTDNGQQFAMMSYCTFSKDGAGDINGVHVTKQVVLVSCAFFGRPVTPWRVLALVLTRWTPCADQWTPLRDQVDLRNDAGGGCSGGRGSSRGR